MAEGDGPCRGRLRISSGVSSEGDVSPWFADYPGRSFCTCQYREGNARGTKRDYANFLSVAKGSLMETETFLMLAVRLKYITQAEASTAFALVTEVSKMLTSLRNRLKEDGAQR